MTDRPKCGTCRAWLKSPNVDAPGECRIRSVPGDDFPLRYPSEWCLEHRGNGGPNDPQMLAAPIERFWRECELSTRARHCLMDSGLQTVGEMVALGARGLLTLKNLGKTTASEITYKMRANGLAFADDLDIDHGGERLFRPNPPADQPTA